MLNLEDMLARRRGGSTISAATRTDTSTLPGARLRRVTDHIRANLEQNLTLARLGAVACMSPYHFARLFHRTTGVPPHRFVLQARIDHAAGLLAKPGPSIAGIARGADSAALQHGVPAHHPCHAPRVPRAASEREPAEQRRLGGPGRRPDHRLATTSRQSPTGR
jgi:transcriptional regulator GlxA family with amidase domain